MGQSARKNVTVWIRTKFVTDQPEFANPDVPADGQATAVRQVRATSKRLTESVKIRKKMNFLISLSNRRSIGGEMVGYDHVRLQLE